MTADIRDVALRELARDIGLCPNDTWRFFAMLLEAPRPFKTAREVATAAGLNGSTFIDRFYDAGLPSPKRYVLGAFFMRVAAGRCRTIAEIHERFGYSSPQAVSLTIRRHLGMTGREFLETETGYTMLRRFRQELVLPYVDRLTRVRLLAPAVAGRPLSRVA